MSDNREWDYQITTRAREDLRALDSEVAERIVQKLEEVVFSEFRSPPEWLEPLEQTGYQKLVVGDYRGLVLVRHQESMLEVHHVGHRRNIYDRVL
jgi:mRNA-degrading endonuclease RelE of RelBE toxin-antitoxin system